MWLYQWVKKKFFLVPKTKKISIIDKKVFVGREEELAILKISLEKTIQKQGQFCILYGEMGYGKTYLWKRFYQTVLIKKNTLMVIQVACSKETSPYTAFEPIFQIISAINKTVMAHNIALEIPAIAGENKQKENHQIWNII